MLFLRGELWLIFFESDRPKQRRCFPFQAVLSPNQCASVSLGNSRRCVNQRRCDLGFLGKQVIIHSSEIALLLGGDPVVKRSGKNLPWLLPPSPRNEPKEVSIKGMIKKKRKFCILLYLTLNWGEKWYEKEERSLLWGVSFCTIGCISFSLTRPSDHTLCFIQSFVPFFLEKYFKLKYS